MISNRFPDAIIPYALKGMSPRETLYLLELTDFKVSESRVEITIEIAPPFFSKKVRTLFPLPEENMFASVRKVWFRDSSLPFFLLAIADDKDSVSPDEYRTKISPSSPFCTRDAMLLWNETFLTLFKSGVTSSQQRILLCPKTPTYWLLFGSYSTFEESLSKEVQLLICFWELI